MEDQVLDSNFIPFKSQLNYVDQFFKGGSFKPHHPLVISFGFKGCGKTFALRYLCRKIFDSESHPDLFWADCREDSSVKFMRDLAYELQNYGPSNSPYRVFILDHAEELGIPAQNSLLKGLEEPLDRNICFMASNSPQLILSTIKSRGLKNSFSGPSFEEINHSFNNNDPLEGALCLGNLHVAAWLSERGVPKWVPWLVKKICNNSKVPRAHLLELIRRNKEDSLIFLQLLYAVFYNLIFQPGIFFLDKSSEFSYVDFFKKMPVWTQCLELINSHFPLFTRPIKPENILLSCMEEICSQNQIL